MTTTPKCPKCQSEYSYEDASLFICSECAHEWPIDAASDDSDDNKTIKDAFGNVLKDGDDITVIKNLKVKGASNSLKVGTKVHPTSDL